jgi:hypothetical protein
LQAASFTAQTAIQFIGNAGNLFTGLTLRNFKQGQINAIDMNNIVINVASYNSYVNPYESATASKVINQPVNAGLQVVGNAYDGTVNTAYAMQQLQGGVRFVCINGASCGYLTQPAVGQLRWWTGSPAVGNNEAMRWDFNSASNGQEFRFWEGQTGETTALLDLNGNSAANQVNMFGPPNVANGQLNIGTHFRFDNASSGNYYQTAGTPTAARTITFSDASGTVGLVLTGTTGSIGGGALLAGACTSGTVSVTNATTSMVAAASPNTYPGDGVWWDAQVTASGTVTVKVCVAIALTPTSSTYNVRVIQ